jgi:hypothetical protein
MLDKPFYDSEEGEIEKASLFSNRFSALCRRKGFAKPPTIHDLRAEGLHIIGKISLNPSSPPRSL